MQQNSRNHTRFLPLVFVVVVVIQHTLTIHSGARRGAPVGIEDMKVCRPEACLQGAGPHSTEKRVHGRGRRSRSTEHPPTAELRVG